MSLFFLQINIYFIRDFFISHLMPLLVSRWGFAFNAWNSENNLRLRDLDEDDPVGFGGRFTAFLLGHVASQCELQAQCKHRRSTLVGRENLQDL